MRSDMYDPIKLLQMSQPELRKHLAILAEVEGPKAVERVVVEAWLRHDIECQNHGSWSGFCDCKDSNGKWSWIYNTVVVFFKTGADTDSLVRIGRAAGKEL
jgi:hypothetical protein